MRSFPGFEDAVKRPPVPSHILACSEDIKKLESVNFQSRAQRIVAKKNAADTTDSICGLDCKTLALPIHARLQFTDPSVPVPPMLPAQNLTVSERYSTAQLPSKREHALVVDLTDEPDESSPHNSVPPNDSPRQKIRRVITQSPVVDMGYASILSGRQVSKTTRSEEGAQPHQGQTRRPIAPERATPSRIIRLRDETVGPILEKSIWPITDQFKIPGFIDEIRSAIGRGEFAVPPEILCIPDCRHGLKDVRLETLLAKEPNRSTIRDPVTGRRVSLARIIANRSLTEAEIRHDSEGSHNCHWGPCIVPKHIDPRPHRDNMHCEICHKEARRLQKEHRPAPLACKEHVPACRMGCAVIPWQAQLLACWMYHNQWPSLDAVPLSMLPDPETVGDFMEFEFCPYEIITSGKEHMVQPRPGKTLRQHIKAKIAAAPKEMSPPMESGLQYQASSRISSPSPFPVKDNGRGDGWISGDEPEVDGEGDPSPGEEPSGTDSSYSGPFGSLSAGPSSDKEDNMPVLGDDSDSMPRTMSGRGSKATKPNARPASKVVRKSKYAGADPTVITWELTSQLRMLTSKNVHSPAYSDKSKSRQLRKVEVEGFRMYMKSDELDQICVEANSPSNGKLSAPCLLCSSDLHKVLTGAKRYPFYTNRHTIGDKPLKILQHIQKHHQHNDVKVLCLRTMLKRVSWLGKLAIVSHTPCDFWLMI